MRNIEDLNGQVFERLTVIDFAGMRKRHSVWNCRCICGNYKIVMGTNLKTGQIKSCGCLRREANGTPDMRYVRSFSKQGKVRILSPVSKGFIDDDVLDELDYLR